MRKNITKDILHTLLNGTAIYIAASSPTGTRRIIKGLKKEWKRNSAWQALERLWNKKLIEYREKSDGVLVATITQAGKRRVKEWDINNMLIQKPKIWDRRWRVVTFDIAEKRKKGREALRGLLRKMGFYQLQRSLYVHPYSCRVEIELIKETFLLPDAEVLYFSTDRVPNEPLLKKRFKLG